MLGLGKALMAGLLTLTVFCVIGYFIVSSLFKSYVELPNNIKILEEKVVALEKHNTEEHAKIFSRLRILEAGELAKKH